MEKKYLLNGLLLIDCPASALNNSNDKIAEARTDNTAATKFIRTKAGKFPYLSAQAFRYWLRDSFPEESKSPIQRAEKIAYTEADPIKYAEDDLFGYMRAEKSKPALSRISPLKVSTFVSISPVNPTADFGVMARHEGDPVPYEHEFYRATLKGLISLDISMVGRFYHISRSGFKHLNEENVKQAKESNLKAFDEDRGFELDIKERKNRVKLLLESLKDITGGAKQSIHYTDVNPKFIMLAVSKNGNNIFNNVISADEKGLPKIQTNAIVESITVFKDDISSKVYVGLPQGYLDEQREALKTALDETKVEYILDHPQKVISAIINDLSDDWFK